MNYWKEEEVKKPDCTMVKTYLRGRLQVLNLGYDHLQLMQIWTIWLNVSGPYVYHQ